MMAAISATKTPPWETFRNELKALFAKDKDVDVSGIADEGGSKSVTVFVTGHDKYIALSKLLPGSKTFGNVKLVIHVYESTKIKYIKDMYAEAFKGNDSVKVCSKGVPGGEFTYVVFEPEVVQFFDDNLGDVNGNKSMLMEEIARNVFVSADGVFFCTDAVSPANSCPF